MGNPAPFCEMPVQRSKRFLATVLSTKSVNNSYRGSLSVALQFHCGEFINMQIDPNSGQLSTIPNAVGRACVGP
jgi:hypothetical protein